MKKKIIYAIIGIFLLLSLMFAEYRFIMHNIKPYQGNGTSEGCMVYIEMFGHMDEYYAEYIGG